MAAGTPAAVVLALALVGCQQLGIGRPACASSPAPDATGSETPLVEPPQTPEPVAARQDPVVVDMGYSVMDSPPEFRASGPQVLRYAAILENPNHGWVAEHVSWRAVFKNASGSAIAYGSDYFAHILPGARYGRGGTSFVSLTAPPNAELEDVRSMEVSIEGPITWREVEPGTVGSFSFYDVTTEKAEGAGTQADPSGYGTSGCVRSTFEDTFLIRIFAVYRDSGGEIIAATEDTQTVPGGGDASFETTYLPITDVASTEVYAEIAAIPDF